jgi:hypothetical protein
MKDVMGKPLNNPCKILVRNCNRRYNKEAFTLDWVAVLNILNGKVDLNIKYM